MPFIVGTGRNVWIPVRWKALDDDGNPATHEIRCKVEIVDKDDWQALLAQISEDASLAFASRVTQDWDGISHRVSGKVQPLPFNKDTFAAMMQSPGFGFGWGESYNRAWNGQEQEREGNSAASPAGLNGVARQQAA